MNGEKSFRRDTHRAQRIVEKLPNDMTLEMIAIPEGSFMMGSHPHSGYAMNVPCIASASTRFLIGKFQSRKNSGQRSWIGLRRIALKEQDDRLIECPGTMPWEFCERLSEKTGRAVSFAERSRMGIRLPRRTTTPFLLWKKRSRRIWRIMLESTFSRRTQGVYRHATTEVGSFPPNAWAFYDMHGNVGNGAADIWHDDYVLVRLRMAALGEWNGFARVLRGGCWHDPPGLCRSAARLKQAPDQGEDFFGFRVALTSLEPHR